jgi:hypothetical protein
MKEIPNIIRTGAMVLTLSAALAAQQGANTNAPSASDTYQKQSQGNAVGNTKPTTGNEASTSNPGFGEPAKNDSSLTGGTDPRSNSTYQKDRNGTQGFDLGWMGLLGLAGLFGLGRGRRSDSVTSSNVHDMRHDTSH